MVSLFIALNTFINVPQNVSYRTLLRSDISKTLANSTDTADFRTRLRIENPRGSVRHPRSLKHDEILKKIWKDETKVDLSKVVKAAFNESAVLALAILQDWLIKSLLSVFSACVYWNTCKSIFWYSLTKSHKLQNQMPSDEKFGSSRIQTVKLKIPRKSRIPNFCYIQVIVFDLSYPPVAAVGS